MTSPPTTYTRWRKSSRSGGDSNCVEVGVSSAGSRQRRIGVRDTKNPEPVLEFTILQWTALVRLVEETSLG
jgi:uncharacterized protein DUF397